MRKQHLSAFAVATRLFKSAGMGDRTSNVARLLINATEKFAGYVLGAALALQRADVAIALASGVKAQVIVPDSASRGEKLASRTGVNVARFIIGEVLAREDAVFALGRVDNWNMGRDLLFVDEPMKVWRGSIRRIGSEPFRLQTKTSLGPIDHRLGSTHLGLADGARGFDVDNHSELHIDKIVVGIGEKRWPAHCSRPLRGRIRWRDELRRDLARCTKGRVIERPRAHSPGRNQIPLSNRDGPRGGVD